MTFIRSLAIVFSWSAVGWAVLFCWSESDKDFSKYPDVIPMLFMSVVLALVGISWINYESHRNKDGK